MRAKYSPSSSSESRSSHGAAVSVNSRLTSHAAGGRKRFWLNFKNSHSTGDKSAHRAFGENFALLARYIKRPHPDERRTFGLEMRWATSICCEILSGASKSSASSH